MKGIAGGILVIIGLGLVLRFGRDSNTLLNTSVGGINSFANILTLSKFQSNGI